MPVLELSEALAEVRKLITDAERFRSAVGAGRQRGSDPSLRRVEFRPVQLRTGRVMQVVSHGVEVRTDNYAFSSDLNRRSGNGNREAFGDVLDEILAVPFANWHVETLDETFQLRVTKKGKAQVHRSAPAKRMAAADDHDREKNHLLAPDDPIFSVLGADGDKRRQVDAFLRNVKAVMGPAVERAQQEKRAVRVADLGCGNAYLTFGIHRWMSQGNTTHGVETVGVELRDELVERSTKRAEAAGLVGLGFTTGTIAGAQPFGSHAPDIAVALHACDTATDEALARAITWRTPVILAAPCCHRDISLQLKTAHAPHPYGALIRQPILRQRFADVFTDSLRSLILRTHGYRVDVVEFIDSRHTPRNAMIRAVYTGGGSKTASAELAELKTSWGVKPALDRLLAQ